MARKYNIPKPVASSNPKAPEAKQKRAKSGHSTAKFDVYEDPDAGDAGDSSMMSLQGGAGSQMGDEGYDIKPISQFSAAQDEEISEDDAFDDSDEEKWGEFFHSETRRAPANPKPVTRARDLLNEDSDEDAFRNNDEDFEPSDFEDDPDAVDLSELLDNINEAGAEKPKRKRVNLDDMSHLPSTNAGMNLASMLSTLDDGEVSSALKKQIMSVDKLTEELGAKKHGLVAAPIAKRLQDKVDREVAYDDTIKEVSKWTPLIKKNRRAEHLQFPMNAAPKQNLTNASLASKFRPETEMENQIDAILQQSGLADEKQIQETEELALNKLDVEEIKAHRAELAKMRALLFYAEQKEKRAAKIKSKKYHRIKKKEKMRLKEQEDAERLKQLGELDPEAAEEERMKLERQRAEERASLRHKNGSKWAKKLADSHEVTEETRQALMERLDRHEQLTRKIRGEDESDSDIDGVDEREVSLADFAKDMEANKPQAEKVKGVFAMKFMQKAMDAKIQAAKERIIEMEESDDDSNVDASSGNSGGGLTIGGNEGRMKFGAHSSSGSKPKRAVDDLVDGYYEPPSDGEEVIDFASQPTVKVKAETTSSKRRRVDPIQEVSDSSNPWLAPPENDGTGAPRTANISRIPLRAIKSDSARASKLLNKMAKAQERHQIKTQEAEKSDSDAESTVEESSPASTKIIVRPSVSAHEDNNAELPEESGVKDISFMSQRDLIQMAFADDDLVEREFAAEKNAEMEQDAPQVQDMTLPGWGDWSGAGITRQPRRKFVVEKPGIKPMERQDAKLAHVVITEKRDKKFADKFLVNNVPFPFRSSEQYESMMRNPMGKEWNTHSTHQKLVKPRISTKKGAVIDPLKFSKISKPKN